MKPRHHLARLAAVGGAGYAARCYLLAGLAPGTYRVLFTPDCVFGAGDFAPQWYGGATTQSQASTVTVTSGATTTGIGGTLTADGGPRRSA